MRRVAEPTLEPEVKQNCLNKLIEIQKIHFLLLLLLWDKNTDALGM